MTMRAARRRVAGILAGVMVLSSAAVMAAADDASPADQQYRPLVHFSPKTNWMNDPNGMVYIDGMYHLFYQHNPQGTRWGNMSWGHATSDDLLHWTEQPLAIPQTFDGQGRPIEDIFSGSVVIDENNTSGFGTDGKTPLVAIYTSAYTNAHPTHAGKQAQSLAYSLDDGMTWTKYENNPVLDRNSANFRDPKVFWYQGDNGEGYWVMVTVEATDHQVLLYKSSDLKSWDYLSTFGPANSVAGIWECPDLFELPVEGGAPGETKWVMVVNLNPGAVAGGSGGQYFVGDFDGTTFTSESTVTGDPLPDGDVFEDFEGGYGAWTVNNEPGNWANGPFGNAPAGGALEGQSPVTGFVGNKLVNSFLDRDWAIGSMTSPAFTVDKPFVNFLVGGGSHPGVPGGQLGNEAPAGSTVLFDFENGSLADNGWQLTGDFATDPGRNPSGSEPGGLGSHVVNTWHGGPNGDGNKGTMTSPEFPITGSHISFLIGAGQRADGTAGVELLVDGEVVRYATGNNDANLNWASWNVSEFAGQNARFRIVDQTDSGPWPQIWVDHVVIGNEPAKVRSDETTVNLIVDGEVVRSTTGNNSENLEWESWNVADLVGEEATISIVDNNRGGWGHILADQFMFSDSIAGTRLERYDWLDWGRDYYATVSYAGTTDDSTRIMHGWMNNWQYAEDIPTSTWRSSMTLPREVSLVQTAKGPRLQQKVIDQVESILDVANAQTVTNQTVNSTENVLGVSGDVVKLDITLDPGTAERAGITVFRAGSGEGAQIGYDTTTGRVFVDRRESGNTGFHPAFASIQDAPVSLDGDGNLVLEVYLDRASVELFADDGRLTITDQVFPLAGADGISVWAEGGSATLVELTVTPLTQTMFTARPQPQLSAVVTERTMTLDAVAQGTQVFRIDYKTDGGDWQRYTEPVTFEGTDAVAVQYRALDRRGVFSNAASLTVAATQAASVTLEPLGSARTVLEGEAFSGYGVRVIDSTSGQPVVGVPVELTVTGATFSGGAAAITATSNASGVAVVPVLTAGSPGTATITATQGGTSVPLPEITVVAPSAALSADLQVVPSLVSGKWQLAVTAKNTGTETVTLKLATKFGTKTFTGVAPDQTVSHSFKTYLAAIPAGTVTATLTGPSGVATETTTHTAQ